jgi:hypothetical protein
MQGLRKTGVTAVGLILGLVLLYSVSKSSAGGAQDLTVFLEYVTGNCIAAKIGLIVVKCPSDLPVKYSTKYVEPGIRFNDVVKAYR